MGQITVQLTGDEARLLRSLDKVIAKERELALAAKKTGQESAKGSRKSQAGLRKTQAGLSKTALQFGRNQKARGQAFGSGAVAQLGRFAGGLGSIAAAGSAVTTVLNGVAEAAKRVAESQSESELGLRSLAQLSGGDRKKFKALTSQAKQVFASGGAGSQDGASDLIFQLESAGINTKENRALFASLFGTIKDTAGFAKSAKTLQASVGKEEAGSIRDIASKSIAAAGGNPEKAAQFLRAASQGGAYATQLGISDEDLLSLVAVTATTTGSASEGGTQGKALLKALDRTKDPELRKRIRETGQEAGLEGILDLLESRGLTSSEAFSQQFGDRAEAFMALSALKGNRELFTQTREAQFDAQDTDLIGRTVSLGDTNSTLYFAKQKRIQAARAEIAAEVEGMRDNAIEASKLRYQASLNAQGRSNASWWVGNGIDFMSSMGQKGLAEDVLSQQGFMSGKDRDRLLDADLSRLENFAEQTARNTQQGSLTGDPRRDR